MMLWDRSKHSSARGSSLSPPFQILTPQTHRQPFREESREKVTVLTWKRRLTSLFSVLQAQYSVVQSLRGGRPAPGARHCGAHFAFGLGNFKNCINGKWPPSEFLIDFKSSEVGTLKTVALQRSSVQPTIAHSESRSVGIKKWTFHFALNASFSSSFENGLKSIYQVIPSLTQYIFSAKVYTELY